MKKFNFTEKNVVIPRTSLHTLVLPRNMWTALKKNLRVPIPLFHGCVHRYVITVHLENTTLHRCRCHVEPQNVPSVGHWGEREQVVWRVFLGMSVGLWQEGFLLFSFFPDSFKMLASCKSAFLTLLSSLPRLFSLSLSSLSRINMFNLALTIQVFCIARSVYLCSKLTFPFLRKYLDY